MRNRLVIALLIVATTTLCLADPPAPSSTDPQYYAILLGGKKIGHAVDQRIVKDGTVTTEGTMNLVISRMGVEIPVRVEHMFRETTDGEPLAFRSMTAMPPMIQQTIEGKIADGTIHAQLGSAGALREHKTQWPAGALMLEGIRLLHLQHGLKAGKTYTARQFSPEDMTALDCTFTVGEPENVDLLGRVVKLTPVRGLVQTASGPVEGVDYLTADGLSLKSTVEMVGMPMEIIACDKAYALSPNDAVDLLAKSIMPSPRPISAAERQQPLTFVLTSTADKGLHAPADDTQTVQLGDDGNLTITVRRLAPAAAAPLGYDGEDPAILAALQPTRYVESDNEQIVAAAKQALGSATTADEALTRLTDFVGQHIATKDLSVGFASAAEVLESGQGDCTEHAVLLAALCRAVGIPAELVYGVTYVDQLRDQENVFGGHAWVRCYVGEQWVHADASLGHDTGHIMLGAGEQPSGWLHLLNMLGQMEIVSVTTSE